MNIQPVPIKGRVRVCLDLLKSCSIKGKVIVDVGSSVGWLEQAIKSSNPKKVIGTDISEITIQQARKNAPYATFILQKGVELPVKDSTADIVTLFDVVEHVPTGKEPFLLSEVYRVLKSDGQLLLSTPNSHWLANLLDPAWYFGHRHYSVSTLERLLRHAGFKVDKISTRGRAWSVLYLFHFYLTRVLTGKYTNNKKLLDLDDDSYDKEGYATIYIAAHKN